MALFRTGGPLLPNVKTVSWVASSREDALGMPLFLSENTVALELRCGFGNPTESSILVALQTLSVQPTNFKIFDFSSEIPVGNTGHLLSQCLTNWTRLTTVLLPEGYATQDQIFVALSKLPELTSISFIWCQEVRIPNSKLPLSALNPQSFPRLKTLKVALKLEGLASLLENPHRPSMIEEIEILDGYMVQRDSLLPIVRLLPSTYPQLKQISLHLTTTASIEAESISFDLFRPLLNCSALEEFAIFHGKPLIIHDADVEAMATSWPQLRILGLTPDPFIHKSDFKTQDAPSYELLKLFASIFPKLQELEVLVDVRNFPPVPEKRILSNRITRVLVGTSPAPPGDLLGFAMNFARLFPNVGEVLSGPHVWLLDREPETRGQHTKNQR